jgi:hypothetical protein
VTALEIVIRAASCKRLTIRNSNELSGSRRPRMATVDLTSRPWAGFGREKDVTIGGRNKAGLELAVFGKTG